MSLERIFAVLQQEFYITARSVEVIVDLPFWSLITVVVFGFVTRFLASVMNPTVAQYLYLGTLMWEIIRVTQYSMSLGALWNVWSHNFSNRCSLRRKRLHGGDQQWSDVAEDRGPIRGALQERPQRHQVDQPRQVTRVLRNHSAD